MIYESLTEADESIVSRPDTEDEDTEQKIINEGLFTLLVTGWLSLRDRRQSTRHGRRTALSFMI
jgi:hypothetical protein